MDWINEDRDRENFSAMEIYRVLSRLYSSDCNSIAYYVLKKNLSKINQHNFNLFKYLIVILICFYTFF